MPQTPEQLENELFMQDWIECGFNAGKAYLKRHPGVTPQSAAVLGHRKLKKVNVKEMLEAAGLGYDVYLNKLREGLNATRIVTSPTEPDREVPDFKTRRDYHKAQGKALAVETDKVEHEVAGELIVRTVRYADDNNSTPL